MNWFIVFCYILGTYGLSVMVTNTIGPFDIFFRIRLIASEISESFGQLFRCMTCFPANVGWVFSLFNWFIVSQVAITPFNIILHGTGLWWLAMILDCCFTAATCRILYNIDDFIDKMTPIYEDEVTNNE